MNFHLLHLDLLRRHTQTGDLITQWVKAGKYRIVKYDIPFTGKDGYYPPEWHLIRTGWFGFVYGVPGSDRGCPGEYNHQLTNANNPLALIDALAEVAQHHINPTKIKRHGRNKLPRTPIIDEIDINATIRALLTNTRQEHPTQDLHQLIKRPK